jgi:hypothetical protein
MTAYCLLLTLLSLFATATPEKSVTAGREALKSSAGDRPWYDAEADDVRPVDLTPPPQTDDVPADERSRGSSWALGALQSLAYLATAAVFAGLAYLLIRALWKWSPEEQKAKKAVTAEEKRRHEALPLQIERPRGNLLDHVRECFEQGRYGEAMVYLFSYQLIELDKRQLIHLTKGKTNRQYLGELRGRMALRQLVEQTMVAFEDFFFGHHPIDRARFESCWTRLAQFESLAAEGSA